jgi:hypothetical protein
MTSVGFSKIEVHEKMMGMDTLGTHEHSNCGVGVASVDEEFPDGVKRSRGILGEIRATNERSEQSIQFLKVDADHRVADRVMHRVVV